MAGPPTAEVLVGKDAADVSKRLCDAIEAAYNSRTEKEAAFVIGLSGGSLPKFFAAGAAKMTVDWGRVKFVFCDERLVPFDDAESTFGVYKASALMQIDGVTEASFVVVDPSLDAAAAAKDYAKKLSDLVGGGDPGLPRLDVLLLGMGPDGHTCSLFPGHRLLDEAGETVAPITDSPKPPPNRVTLTYPVINNAAACIFVCTGEGKKDVVSAILDDGTDYPAGRVRPTNGKLVWILDSPAASTLKRAAER